MVHGNVAAVLAPPTVRAAVRSGDSESWSVAGLHEAFGPLFTDAEPRPGFVCEATLPLAAATIGEGS